LSVTRRGFLQKRLKATLVDRKKGGVDPKKTGTGEDVHSSKKANQKKEGYEHYTIVEERGARVSREKMR